jgi:CTD small phosphatase-like protein 2
VASKPYLPRELSHKYTLILDMDETLIHFIDQTKNFLVRPYTDQFLQEMSQYFEIAVFTAGLPDYANWVLD